MQAFIELAFAYKMAPMGSAQSQAALEALCACVEHMVLAAGEGGMAGFTERFQLLEGGNKMIPPTIGRIVWFHPPRNEHVHGGTLQAAIVCFVHNERLVNLAVFDHQGRQYPATSIELWQGDTDRPKDYYCEWMPYQIGQAARHVAELPNDGRRQLGSGSQATGPGIPQNDGPRAA